MKKILITILKILIVLFVLIGCNSNSCQNDSDGLCEIESIAILEIEKDAKVIVGVFSDGFGKDLIKSWNLNNPTHKDLLTYKVIEANNNEELLSNIAQYDLIQLKSEYVPLYFEHLAPLDESFATLLESDVISKFSSQINQSDFYFMPFDVEGLLFAYNKTMLEHFEVDLTDKNEQGLPEAIDSFEKIAELASQWRKDKLTYLDKSIETIFSFPLNDQLAMIPFVENSGYHLISGTSAEMMNVNNDLLNALTNLQSLGRYKWNFNENLSNDSVWNYEQVLIDQSAPFLLVGNWMFYDHYQTSKAYELSFSKLPQINGSDIASISSVSGFVLNKDSEYPNAANMVLKHIKNTQGIQDAINNGIIPVTNAKILDSENFKADKNTKQQIIAYSHSETPPLQAFEQKPQKRGWDIYLENDFRDVYKKVFLNEVEPELALIEIKKIIIEWLDNENIIVEGLNDEQLETDN